MIGSDGFSLTVAQETRLFLGSCLLGLPLGILLDCLRLLRAVLPHHTVTVFIEDALFACICCILLQTYAAGFGESSLRWYYAAGALLGLLLYLLTIGAVIARALQRIRALSRRIARTAASLCKKAGSVFVRYAKKSKKVQKNAQST